MRKLPPLYVYPASGVEIFRIKKQLFLLFFHRAFLWLLIPGVYIYFPVLCSSLSVLKSPLWDMKSCMNTTLCKAGYGYMLIYKQCIYFFKWVCCRFVSGSRWQDISAGGWHNISWADVKSENTALMCIFLLDGYNPQKYAFFYLPFLLFQGLHHRKEGLWESFVTCECEPQPRTFQP